MRNMWIVSSSLAIGVNTAIASAAPVAGEAVTGGRSIWDLIIAGGWAGFTIIALSLVGGGLVVDAFRRMREVDLVPPVIVERVLDLSRKGRFEEIQNLCKLTDCLLCRVVLEGLSAHKYGVEAVREGFQQQGVREITKLRQRLGYVGLIAAIAPMLGLLGTVTGMISSFQLLGDAQGTARPDELALGISQALITTCMGLVLAVPLTFFYAFFRDRVTRIGHEAGAVGGRMLRIMDVLSEKKKARA